MTDRRLVAERVTGRPDGPLAEVVDRVYGYAEVHPGPVWHRGLPGTGMTVIIGVGSAIEVTMPGDTAGTSYRLFTGGLHDSAAMVRHDGRQRGVQLTLRPEACARVFGMPARALAGEVVDLDALLGESVAGRLVERVGEAERLGGAR